MKELNDIVQAYDIAVLQNKKTALVTVVQVIGSSYRRPGARMLVTEDGAITGAISGGCLEGDALRKAQLAIFRQQNRLEIYDTTSEEDQNLGIQLGCNGIVYILFEPIRADDPDNPIHLLKKVVRERKNAVLATIFQAEKKAEQPGTRYLIYADDLAKLPDNTLKADVPEVFRQQASVVKSYAEYSISYQFVPPVIQLIVIGAGNDVQPLLEMAALLGWLMVIADGRPGYATQARFPKAHQVLVTKPGEPLEGITLDERSAVLLMTHNYPHDLAALAWWIQTDCPYIGILGPRKKLTKMLEELQERGIDTSGKTQLYGPIGLDIGAETSEEIALSIIAEIKAVFSGRAGMSLRDRTVEIHERG
ncbi:MAG TPA: XdhC/CoxI family protein [Saprospiraceae bacterium]|nr:XdhC/CoxI family protein [Saprospiraceae bacterium]